VRCPPGRSVIRGDYSRERPIPWDELPDRVAYVAVAQARTSGFSVGPVALDQTQSLRSATLCRYVCFEVFRWCRPNTPRRRPPPCHQRRGSQQLGCWRAEGYEVRDYRLRKPATRNRLCGNCMETATTLATAATPTVTPCSLMEILRGAVRSEDRIRVRRRTLQQHIIVARSLRSECVILTHSGDPR
jgi:hypothetical protein